MSKVSYFFLYLSLRVMMLIGLSRIGAEKPNIVERSVRARHGVWDTGIGAARGMERREKGSMFLVPLPETMEKIDGPVVPPRPAVREHPTHLLQQGFPLPLLSNPPQRDFITLNRNPYPT
jgi:hypothetical protein